MVVVLIKIVVKDCFVVAEFVVIVVVGIRVVVVDDSDVIVIIGSDVVDIRDCFVVADIIGITVVLILVSVEDFPVVACLNVIEILGVCFGFVGFVGSGVLPNAHLGFL